MFKTCNILYYLTAVEWALQNDLGGPTWTYIHI